MRRGSLWFAASTMVSLLHECYGKSTKLKPSVAVSTDAYGGRYRPQIHFSPPRGFMNDPNGMFKDSNGTYHLYYQLNPSGVTSGNQHWGHATSEDLYHWTNQAIALSPDSADEGIFSGSAVVDYNNTSGFFPDQTNGVVAIYTLNTPEEQSQHIAFSRDGGYTFTKYKDNPVISIGSNEFRDPKVIWHTPTSRWVAVIAYAREYVVGIWTSPDLRDWTHASNFSHAGLLGLQYECPNLVPIPMLKNSSLPSHLLFEKANIVENADLWLMFISINPGAPLGGSASQYIPGHFNGTHFEPVDGAARLMDIAKDNYAGQFFAEIPANEPQISIQWASNWQYTNNVPTDTEGWRSIMALPRRHVLAHAPRTPFALLSTPPSLHELYTTSVPLVQDQKLANRTLNYDYGLSVPSGALELSIVICNIPEDPHGSLNFTFLSSTSGEKLEGGYVLSGDSTFFLDRSGTHGFTSPFFTGQFSAAHPVNPNTNCFSLLIVIDRTVIEVFLDNGVRSATSIFFPTSPLDRLTIASEGLDDGVEVSAEVHGLQSTWTADRGHDAMNASRSLQQEATDCIWSYKEVKTRPRIK